MGLEFFPATHEYRWNGELIPSVTQIIAAAGLVDHGNAPQDRLDYAAERGTAVHLACQYWDEDDLDLDSLDAEAKIMNYVVAWKNFRRDHRLTILASEQKYCGDLNGLLFGATVDRLVQFDIGGRPTIIDIKTARDPKPWYPVQLAGYACGLQTTGTIAERLRRYRRLIVHLKPDCTYRLYEYNNDADGETFEQALIDWWAARECAAAEDTRLTM